jgi:hypothetical protein
MMPELTAPPFLTLPTGVAKFPRERFLQFLSRLRITSRDVGLVPFRLLGTQRYILDGLCAGLDAGISTFYILKARQVGCCLSPELRVLTSALRWVAIGDVKIGDELIGVDEHGGAEERGNNGRRMHTARVTGAVVGHLPCVMIWLDDGTCLTASLPHPWLCRQRGSVTTEWRKSGELRIGDYIRAVTKPWSGVMDVESAWFGGLLDGEGSLRQKEGAGVELTMSQVAGPVFDRACRYVHERGYSWREDIDKRDPGDSSKLGSQEVHKIVVGRCDQIFRLIGETRPARFIGREFWEGKKLPSSGDSWRRIVGVREVGECDVVDLQTTTGTYVCEGVVSHNTTFFLAVDMFWAFEHKGLLGTFIIHKEEARDDWRQTIDNFYDSIPRTAEIDGRLMRLKPAMTRHNRNILSFSNGSRFRYLIAGTAENRRGGLGRSGAVNYVHGTEAAFYGNPEDIKAFKSSTSSIFPYRLQVWESTANGFNHFEQSYQAAKDSPATRVMFVGWWRDERNQFLPDHPLYGLYCPDRSLTNFERSRVKAVKGEYGFEISMPQLAWYRWKLREEFDNDEQMMLQEFPFTDEDAFQATGSKYFAAASLTEATREARRVAYTPWRYRLERRWQDIRVQAVKDPRAELRIWEHSSKFGHYVVSCDPAYGSSDTADRTVIQVWRAFAECLVQVAEFATPVVSTYQCAWILAHLAGFYGQHDVGVILEITGPGTAVWQELQRLQDDFRNIKPGEEGEDVRNLWRHMRHYFYRRADSLGGELCYHWRMSEELKRSVMAKLKDAFELKRIIVRSVPLLEEMRHIVNDEGYIAAESGYKDDRVIAAALAFEYYRAWMCRKLMGQQLTRERSAAIEQIGGEKPMDMLMREYLKKSNIRADAPARVRQPWERGPL